MTRIKNTISFSKQIITLYMGIFIIISMSYFVISKNYNKISRQKDKINQIENIKFDLYELNFKINQKEIKKIALKVSADSIDFNFKKLIDLSSPLYDITNTDSTQLANLLLHQTDEEKRLFDAYKSWKYFMYLLDKSYINGEIYNQYRVTETENKKILNHLTFTRQLISAKLSKIRKYNLGVYKNIRNRYSIYFIFITIINLLYIIYMYFYTKKIILNPLDDIVKNSSKVTHGKLNKFKTESQNLEINEISNTINFLITENIDATHYIQKITSGENTEEKKLNHKYTNSNLFTSIREMQSELESIAKDDEERKWITEGLAVINEILNRYSHDFDLLTTEIIKHLVKYTGSLQGGLFTVTKNDTEQPIYLELVASYAYDRNKFINKKINKGEGLLGQVWIENKGIYIENIPENHMEIKSFVGHTPPKSILIETLIDNKDFYGIIELASLQEVKKYQREFVSKIAENIAATLASVENNNRTKNLLEESQHMTVKLQKQEEEMTQNLDKLRASQEEIKRREIQKENELKAFTEQFNEELNNHKKVEIEKDHLIEKLQNDLLFSKTDNDVIRKLKEEIEQVKRTQHQAQNDLLETIKIKEMRIEKYKKKITKLQENL
jgi:hypothetical protein